MTLREKLGLPEKKVKVERGSNSLEKIEKKEKIEKFKKTEKLDSKNSKNQQKLKYLPEEAKKITKAQGFVQKASLEDYSDLQTLSSHLSRPEIDLDSV